MPAARERRGGRPKARDLVLRVLYEADTTGNDPREVLDLAFGRLRFTEEGRRYGTELIRLFLEQNIQVDQRIKERLEHWELDRLGVIERAILRLATVEILYLEETPAPVILDEALRLAHRYCDPASVKFINGVLDPIARNARAGELSPPETSS